MRAAFASSGHALRDGDALPLVEVISIADNLHGARLRVASRLQPRQVADGLAESRDRLGREKPSIIRMRAAMGSFVGHIIPHRPPRLAASLLAVRVRE